MSSAGKPAPTNAVASGSKCRTACTTSLEDSARSGPSIMPPEPTPPEFAEQYTRKDAMPLSQARRARVGALLSGIQSDRGYWKALQGKAARVKDPHYADQAGLRVAEAVYNRIKEQVVGLDTFPERARPGRVPGTRECSIDRLPHITVIDVGADWVTVLSVVHTARKYPPEL